jgi:hypothetical protein
MSSYFLKNIEYKEFLTHLETVFNSRGYELNISKWGKDWFCTPGISELEVFITSE